MNYLEEFTEMIDPNLTREATIGICIAAALVVLVLLWLIFRFLRLWYWKINVRAKALRSIDENIKGMREDIRTASDRLDEKLAAVASGAQNATGGTAEFTLSDKGTVLKEPETEEPTAAASETPAGPTAESEISAESAAEAKTEPAVPETGTPEVPEQPEQPARETVDGSTAPAGVRRFTGLDYNVGSSGKIYTREELEQQIRE